MFIPRGVFRGVRSNNKKSVVVGDDEHIELFTTIRDGIHVIARSLVSNMELKYMKKLSLAASADLDGDDADDGADDDAGRDYATTLATDGEYVVANGLKCRDLYLWRIDTGVVLWRKRTGTLTTGLAIAPSKEFIVSCGRDRSIRVISLHTGDQVHCWKVTCRPRPNFVVVTPDSQYVACSFYGGQNIIVLSISTGDRVRTFRGHDSSVRGMTITPDGMYLVSAGFDGLIRVWSMMALDRESDGRCLGPFFDGVYRLRHHARDSCGEVPLIVTPDSRYLLSCDTKRIVAWSLATGEEVWYANTRFTLSSIAASPDSQQIIGYSSVKIYTWVTPLRLALDELEDIHRLYSLCIERDDGDGDDDDDIRLLPMVTSAFLVESARFIADSWL